MAFHNPRYRGPVPPPKGNCMRVRIDNGVNKPFEMNPCSYGVAIAFATRWNQKTKSGQASVVFFGEESGEQTTQGTLPPTAPETKE